MLDKILQLSYLKTIDPIWHSLGPLIIFNSIMVTALIFYRITYERYKKVDDVDLKEHSFMLSRFLKDWWYWITDPFAKLAVKMHLTPNVITTFGFVGSVIAGYIFHAGMFGLGGWFMIFSASCDMLDGRVARLTGRESKSGAYYDSIMDRFGEAAVFAGLISYYQNSVMLYVTIIALVGAMMTSYTKARGEGVGVNVKKGIMQRPERIVYLGVGSILSPIFAYIFSPIYPLPPDIITMAALVLIAVMTNLTAISRARYVIKKLDPRKLDPRPKSGSWLSRRLTSNR